MEPPIERLRESMVAQSVEALLVTHLDNLFWLTGFTGSFAMAVVTGDAALFITDSRYTIQAQEQVHGFEIATFKSPTTGLSFLAEHAKRLGLTRLAFESDHVTYATYHRWRDGLPNVELVPVGDLIGLLRLLKSPEEIRRIRKACELADLCFEHVRWMIRPGISEREVDLEIEFFFRRHGATCAFESIVVSGPNSARPHGRASERLLKDGDFLTLDFGAKLDGYCSDITRTVVIGHATDRHREIYEQVLKAQEAAIEAMRPGVVAKEVDAKARAVLAEKDLAEFFGHGLGHGLGIAVHDTGSMNATGATVLAPGQVWTVEPGVYIEGFGGVRIEDDVVVTEECVEVLTTSPKELMEIAI